MKCPNCGETSRIRQHDKFCHRCGCSLKGTTNALIPPMELKTIEVDVEKRIFNVNGKPFGEDCTAFSISCDSAEGYKIRMEINAMVHLASYAMDNGKKKTDHTYEVQSD